ncbi:MAG: hypothetical protein GY852_09000 [bacterium]|nr:hypothetical protein [bacterium]
MHKQISLVLIISFLVVAGCSEADIPKTVDVEVPAPVLSVPGVILLPQSEDFTEMEESGYDAILLYCWLPMGQYPESENDLSFLSTVLERGITPVPIQFNTEVRNASQTQLNQMGISLSVALGDDSLRSFFIEDVLPAAVLVRSDGSIMKAYGFGCAERVVRGTL